MEIGILYNDFTQVWKPFSEIADFKKEEVLIIVATTERGTRKGLVFRLWEHDTYAIAVESKSIFWDQWDDEDKRIYGRNLDDLNGANVFFFKTRQFPAGASMYIFTGGYVEPPDWKAAITVMDNEMF